MDVNKIIEINSKSIEKIEQINASNEELLRLNVLEQDVWEKSDCEDLKFAKLDTLKDYYSQIKQMVDDNKATIVKFKHLNELLSNANDDLADFVLTFNDIVKFYKEEK